MSSPSDSRALRARTIVDAHTRRVSIDLSKPAIETLVRPLVEAARDDPHYWAEAEQSVATIVDTIASEAAAERIPRRRFLSTEYVFRALHLNWCRIPPFCGRPESSASAAPRRPPRRTRTRRTRRR